MKHYLTRLVDYVAKRFALQLNKNFKTYISLRQLLIEDAVTSTALYVTEKMPNAMMFENKYELWAYCVNKAKVIKAKNPKQDYVLMEFGVLRGESINFFADKFSDLNVYGFDSFEGLEEDWVGNNLPKGAFDLRGELPKVLKNIELVKGWVSDTVPLFIPRLAQNELLIVHFDMDTYTPTKFVLNRLLPFLKSETILIFDEYFGYRSWENHEFKAWQEFCTENLLKYEYLAFTDIQVAIIVK